MSDHRLCTAVRSGHEGTRRYAAGRRAVTIPPHLTPTLVGHLDAHVEDRPDALLFPARHGGHMAPSALHTVFYPARDAAGRADLRFHDLRHTGAVLAAATGATLADLMAPLGHPTPKAALIYQHSRYPVEQIAEAHRYVEQGYQKGHAVITVAPAGGGQG